MRKPADPADGWASPESVLPVEDVVPRYGDLQSEIDAWVPVVLVDGRKRVAVVVAWDWWTLQHERYLQAAAAGWEYWRTGEFNASAYGWEVLGGLRRLPVQPPVHPGVPTDGEDDDDPAR